MNNRISNLFAAFTMPVDATYLIIRKLLCAMWYLVIGTPFWVDFTAIVTGIEPRLPVNHLASVQYLLSWTCGLSISK